jgi:hypothetical protein
VPKPQQIVREGSPVVRALEDAWATIRHHHPELPEPCIVVGAGSGTKQHLRHGHPAAMSWQGDHQRLSVDEDRLNREAVDVLGTLLHEAAHALAQARNINDTSRRGRHNRRFAGLAEELGLQHDRRLGWTLSTPATDRIARYGRPSTVRTEHCAATATPNPLAAATRHHRTTPGPAPATVADASGCREPPSASVRSSARSAVASSTLTEPRRAPAR